MVVSPRPDRRRAGPAHHRLQVLWSGIPAVPGSAVETRTREWLQGKNWDHTTPVGPYLDHPGRARRYVTTMVRLHPGDLIATGTPGGVGHARTPPAFLDHGAIVTTEIEGIGRLRNRVTAGAR